MPYHCTIFFTVWSKAIIIPWMQLLHFILRIHSSPLCIFWTDIPCRFQSTKLKYSKSRRVNLPSSAPSVTVWEMLANWYSATHYNSISKYLIKGYMEMLIDNRGHKLNSNLFMCLCCKGLLQFWDAASGFHFVGCTG